MLRKVAYILLQEEKAQKKRDVYVTQPHLYSLARIIYIKFVDYVYKN